VATQSAVPRMFPIGRILAASLLLLATIPALLAAWLFLRAGNQAVESLAGKLLTEVALVVQPAAKPTCGRCTTC
jgi:hypothetical protein